MEELREERAGSTLGLGSNRMAVWEAGLGEWGQDVPEEPLGEVFERAVSLLSSML